MSMLAQITITSATLPALGDSLQYTWSYNQATFDMITPPGFDLSWNFTGLTANAGESEIYRSPSTGQFAAQFPLANLLVVNGAGERYYRVTASGLELLGYTDNDLFGYSFQVLYKNYVPYPERITPLNFFDSHSKTTSNLTKIAVAELPLALQLAYISAGITTMDSIRLRNNYNKFFAVNASGTITLAGPEPKPAYAVLRQVYTEYSERRVDGKIYPLGWIDITDITRQYVPGSINQLGVDTIVAHVFFNDVTKEEIVRIELDSQGRPGNIRYKNNFPIFCAIKDGRSRNDWTGYAGNTWENAANWGCGIVPATTTDVFVNSGTVVVNSDVIIRSLQVNPGAQVTVGAGSLKVLH